MRLSRIFPDWYAQHLVKKTTDVLIVAAFGVVFAMFPGRHLLDKFMSKQTVESEAEVEDSSSRKQPKDVAISQSDNDVVEGNLIPPVEDNATAEVRGSMRSDLGSSPNTTIVDATVTTEIQRTKPPIHSENTHINRISADNLLDPNYSSNEIVSTKESIARAPNTENGINCNEKNRLVLCIFMDHQ